MKRMKKAVSLLLAFGLVLGLAGCGSKKKGTINVATKTMTEQYILGEIMKILIEEKTDLEVNITKGVGGGTANIHAGLLSEDFDMYAEYTSTAWLNVLKETEIPDNETLYQELQEKYRSEFDLEWVGLYGFNNTYGLLVDDACVEKYGLKTQSDLAKYSDELIFGANYDYFEREDGYNALCDAYGMHFKEAKDMDMGLKYSALESGQVNVIPVFTTDAQISVAKGKVLEDDKNFFVSYYCGTVVRGEILEEYPELRDVLMLLDGAISDEEMSAMNYKLEVEHGDEEEIAREFLLEKGLISDG